MSIKNFFVPRKYLNKLYNIFRSLYYRVVFDEKKLLDEQKQNFIKNNWDYDKSLDYLNKILSENKLDLFDDSGDSMLSQHLIVFAALRNFKPKRILEIGTYDGKTSFLLSKFFVDSQIITFDLDENSAYFNYNWKDADDKHKINFLQKRNQNLNQKNIKFIKDNSFNIPQYKLSNFDLIWVDGDHTFPVLAWDICNAYHLLNSKGIMICDDIFLKQSFSYEKQSDVYEILEYLKGEGILDIRFVLKRLSKSFSSDPALRKHIAVIQKK